MLKIRLQRVGRKHEPSFRVVLTDSKNGPKSGKSLEVLGAYDPRELGGNKNNNHLDSERITYWVSQGAKVSDTVHNLLVDAGLKKGEKIKGVPKKKAPEVAKEGESKENPSPEKLQEKSQTENTPENTQA